MTDKRLADAFNYYKGKWPPEMVSGVIFWDGMRITHEDFIAYGKTL